MSLSYIMENSSKIKEFCTEALKAYLEALESEKIKILISFYGCIQMKVTFDGKGISQPDNDHEDTESEWKLFQ